MISTGNPCSLFHAATVSNSSDAQRRWYPDVTSVIVLIPFSFMISKALIAFSAVVFASVSSHSRSCSIPHWSIRYTAISPASVLCALLLYPVSPPVQMIIDSG